MNFPKLHVTEKGELALRGGHPWVYADEVTDAEPYENGDLVDVYSKKERYLGTGFTSDFSKIRVRVISKNKNDRFDDAFWERRLRHAVDFRRTVMGDDFSCCRLIFGEADYFPGLTVDLFTDVLVTEVLSLGIDRIRDRLYPALVRILGEYGVKIDAVYERNAHELRAKEGLARYDGFYPLPGLSPYEKNTTEIVENGVRYTVDFVGGQKTGFFLDQKYNRLAVAKLARGKRVLDLFTHTGSFGLNCARGGAAHVTSVDISADAIAMAEKNRAANGLSGVVDYVTADVFSYLDELLAAGRRDVDLIILDPPAFTKSRDTLKNAIRGYREINTKAMRLLPRGGYFATCSCSHFMTETYFKQMLHNAAEDAGVTLRQIEARTQSPDHPILWGVPETSYLKFFIFQVV